MADSPGVRSLGPEGLVRTPQAYLTVSNWALVSEYDDRAETTAIL